MNTPFSTSFSFTNTEWNNLVFENRNKAYGAFYIREHYNRNLAKAMSISIFICLSPLLFIFFHPKTTAIVDTKPPIDTLIISPPKIIITPPSSGKNMVVSTIAKPNTPIEVMPDNTPVTVPTPEKPTVPDENPSANGNTNDTHGNDGNTGTGITPVVGTGQETQGTATTMPDTAFRITEILPSFPGGDEALNKYLAKHIEPTRLWNNEGESGKVFYQFIVGRDGKVRDVQIISDKAKYGCAENNIDAIKNMPAWHPGVQNGHEVSVIMILPVVFKKE